MLVKKYLHNSFIISIFAVVLFNNLTRSKILNNSKIMKMICRKPRFKLSSTCFKTRKM